MVIVFWPYLASLLIMGEDGWPPAKVDIALLAAQQTRVVAKSRLLLKSMYFMIPSFDTIDCLSNRAKGEWDSFLFSKGADRVKWSHSVGSLPLD